MRAFWFLNGQIHRNLAELDLRSLTVQAAAVAGTESQLQLQQSLKDEIGKVTDEVIIPDLDAAPEEGASDILRSLM